MIASFGYILAVALLDTALYITLTVLGLAFDVAANHTAVELVAGALTSAANRVAPSGFGPPAELLMMVAVGPFLAGTRIR